MTVNLDVQGYGAGNAYPARAVHMPLKPRRIVASNNVQTGSTVKMMAVGDSITQGTSGDWTWRYRLYKHWAANGVTVNFVGPNDGLENIMTPAAGDQDHTYADPVFDQDHNARWGQPLATEAAEISTKVATHAPDYLLVLLGINDLVWLSHTPAQAESSMRSFIANARLGNPNLKIVFSKLLPTQRAVDDSAFAATVANFNQRLVAVAAELTNASSPVAVADPTAEFVPDQHTWDGTHANPRGELRIAAAFADVLSGGFGLGTSYPRPYADPVLGPQQSPEATVTPTDPGKADLAWTPSLGATAYWVWTKDQGLNPEWTRLPIPLTSDFNPWHMDNLVAGMTYQWKVQATKGNNSGAFSNEVTLTVPGATPAAPSELTITSGDRSATLRWTQAADATAYIIYVKNVTFDDSDFLRLPYPVEGEQWVAEDLINGAQYEFKIQAVNGMIEGGTTAATSVIPSGPPPPAAVNDLSVTNGNGEATLQWTEVPNATGYYIHVRNITDGETSFSRLPWPVPGPLWTSKGLANGAEYEFKIQSANGLIDGGISNVAVAHPTVAPPAGPMNLSAAAGNGQATLTWLDAADATGYFVHVRNVTAGETAFSKLPFAVPGTEWVAAQLVNGATYEFKLQSVSGLIEGGFSNTVTVQPTVAPPAGPTSLTITNGDHEATLNWTPATNATGYFVHVKNVTAGETSFTRLPIAVPGAKWVAGLLSNGATYQFKLQSVSGLIEGGFSNTVTARPTGPAPTAPTNFVARPGDGMAVLTWDMPANATCVYIHVRNVTAGETVFTRLPIPICDDSWTAGELNNGGTYEFKIQAYNDLIPGGTTSAVSVRPTAPPPPAPENLTVTRGNQKATLQWTGSSQATGYYIWVREVTFGRPWQRLPFAIGFDHFVAANLVNGASYEFKVQSVDGYIPGGYSNTVQAVPLGPTPQVGTLRVTPRLGEAELSWSRSSTSTGYFIWTRNVSAGESFTQLAWAIAGPTFVARSLFPGDRYEFKVQAVNGLQRGVYSNTIGFTVPLPATPTGLTASQGGPYSAKLRWNSVPGADGYVIYHGVTQNPLDDPDMRPLPFPVSKTSFTASYLFQRGIHHFAVAATKFGRTGPLSMTDTMSPLMDNPYFLQADYRYFRGGPNSRDKRIVVRAPAAPFDGGIVVARAFIANFLKYRPISDGRSHDHSPYASARIHVAWRTQSDYFEHGQFGVYAQASCVFAACTAALWPLHAQSSASDGDPVSVNYFWDSGTGSNLTFHWKATNSDTAWLWAASAHIDTTVNIRVVGGNQFAASLVADHFPSYEVYQYPRYSTNGVAAWRTMVTCTQYEITGLYDSPSERRTCA